MFLLKSEVNEEGVSREIWYALGVAAALHLGNMVVSSLTDGTHNPGSLHPTGRAVDLRIRDLTDVEALAWFHLLQDALNPLGFDVVFEGGMGTTPATSGAHIHIEFDPKPGESFIYRIT